MDVNCLTHAYTLQRPLAPYAVLGNDSAEIAPASAARDLPPSERLPCAVAAFQLGQIARSLLPVEIEGSATGQTY